MARVTTAASAELDKRLAQMIAAAPAGISVNSEVRTPAQQQKLWDAALKKYGSAAEARKWVAPPGHSQHGLGHAADLAFATPAARTWAHANAAKFGLVFPLGNEPWHVEVVGARSGTVAATGATSTTGTPVTDQQIRDYVISHYGYAASYLHDKEIGPILLDAAKRGIGADELRGKLQATNWWKTHTDAQVKWDSKNEQNPAQAQAEVAGSIATISRIAKQNGIQLTSLQIHDLAVLYNRNGWNDDQLNNAMRYQAKIDPNVVAVNLGQYATLAATNPEIKHLVDQANANGWSQAQFNQAVQGTNWWRTTPVATRNAQLGQVNDPTAESQARQVSHDKVIQASRTLGVPQTDAVNQLADQAYLNGWDDNEINRRLSDMIHLGPGGTGATGQTATTVASLKSQAQAYLVPLSDQTLQQWVSQIQRGDVPATSFDAYLKGQAKIMRPWAAKQIDAGLTTAQVVDPYKNLIASTLDMPAEQVDFTNPKFSMILDGAQDGSGQHGPMSLSQAGQYLRGLDEYKKTAGAVDQAAQFATMLTKTFGKVA